MALYFNEDGGYLYQGDPKTGDREATPEEIAAWESARAANSIHPVSPRQIRQALTRADLRAQVEAAVAAGDQDLKDWYAFSTSFERVNPQVMAMGAALGVSDAQLDDLWRLAATL